MATVYTDGASGGLVALTESTNIMELMAITTITKVMELVVDNTNTKAGGDGYSLY